MENFKRFWEDPELDRINNMVRWNGLNRIKDETVAHHSYIVAFFSRILAEEIFEDNEMKFLILSYALSHDYDEIFTGDILNPFKYNEFNGNEVRGVIDDFLKFKIEQKFNTDSATDKMFRDVLNKTIIPPIARKIVKIADWISMYFYLKKERQLGNMGVDPQNRHCIQNIRLTCQDAIDYLNENSEGSQLVVNIDILEEIKNTHFI